jgi:vacuolar protein sorting-associated protein 8
MASVSASLIKHSDRGAAKVYCGLPTCLAFNSKFIAIGTQLGVILMYDLFEVLRQRLGVTSHLDDPHHHNLHLTERNAGSITSLDLSHNGDTIVAGYVSGIIALWDTIRGIVLRTVTDTHPSPITAVRFLRDLKIVSVDSSGLVHKMTFTKNLLWTNYSVDTECLLDGTAGQILSVNVLQPYSTVKPLLRPEALAKVLRNLTLISLSSERSSFAVAVEPKVNVLHRWARPPADRTNVITESTNISTEKLYLPCLSWGWALISGGGNVVMPILARAWGCCLQLLCASFPTLDDDNVPSRIGEEPIIHWPAFGIHQEIDAKSPIVSLEWLNERSLAYLTASYELTLVDTVMMTLLERLDFSDLKLVYAEFTLSRAAEKLNGEIASISGACTTFLNSTRCSDDRIMIVCQDELRCISIVGARRRISALEADGEWLEALAFALDHYENTVLSQEDRRRDPNARKDLARHPEFSAAKSDEEEWIAKLLVRYLNLAVENAPDVVSVSTDQSSPYSPHGVSSRIDLAQSHFQMLAGVCVEFCVATRRLDLLFGPIFRRFQSAGYIAVFLDVLEPYVLNDKLKYIAPEVMSYLVEHCKATNGIATVERCLLHMDCTIMDFDSILSLLRTNEMYSALFYVFNQGLDDYVTPLEIMLEKVFSEADRGGAAVSRRKDGVLQNDFERLGYKALLYLQACFNGKTFPQESALEPEDRALTVKVELLRFLMQERFSPSSHVKKAVNLLPEVGQRSLLFPYIRVLLLVDPRGMLYTISIALNSTDVHSTERRSRSASESVDGWVDGGSTKSNQVASMPDLQEIMVDIAAILLPKSPSDQTLSEANVFRSHGAVNAFLDFAANYIISGTVRMEKSIVFKILSRIAGQYAAARDSAGRQNCQRKVMDVLSALPRDSYEPDKVLAVFNEAAMHRAALLLHQQVASSWHEAGQDDIVLRSQHFLSAIDCYMEDEDPTFRMEVFKYVKKECSGIAEITHPRNDDAPGSIRESLFTRLSVLVNLDALMTARLVAELLVDDLDQVISALGSQDGGKGQFMFLQAIVSGELLEADPVAGSVLNLTMDHHHTYLTLMAKLHPEMVYDYLSTHDNYRTEECLRLCEDHDIADASAYLLERMGKVTNALQLVLQTLETRMMSLKRTIRGLGVDMIRNHTSRPFAQGRQSRGGPSLFFPCKHESEVDGVRRILIVALDLCERNSGSFAPSNEVVLTSKYKQSELWFSVLDRLINAKGFLRLSKEQPEHAKIMSGVLSELLRLTMQRMVSSVPLSDLVRKVTADHSGSQIGELREMVEGLLATYGFELKVVKGAVMTFHDDVRLMRKNQLELQLRGASVLTLMNAELKPPGNGMLVNNVMVHPLSQSGVIRVSGRGNATIIPEDRFSSSHRAENGLIDAMKRLRSRRGVGEAHRRSSDLCMLTVTDRMFYGKETEPVVDGERLVGALGEAEHRGRLIMTYNKF